MAKGLLSVVFAVALLALVAGAVWQGGEVNGRARHCRDVLGGIAVRTGFAGEVVCMKPDALLREYK